MLESFTSATFTPLVGESFHFEADGSTSMEARLAEVNEWLDATGGPARSAPGRRRPFSVIFHGSLYPVWPQRIYRVTNDKLGSFDLFIVPIGPQGDAMRYEAVFT